MIIAPKLSNQDADDIILSQLKKIMQRIKFRNSRISRTELVFLPYFVFEIDLGEEVKRLKFSVDGILGSVLVYAVENFEYLTETDHLACKAAISMEEAEKAVLQYSKNFLLDKGMKFNMSLSLKDIRYQHSILYPYWVVYIKKRGKFDFMAIDALSGEIQGIQMRRLFLKAFRQAEVDNLRERDE